VFTLVPTMVIRHQALQVVAVLQPAVIQAEAAAAAAAAVTHPRQVPPGAAANELAYYPANLPQGRVGLLLQ